MSPWPLVASNGLLSALVGANLAVARRKRRLSSYAGGIYGKKNLHTSNEPRQQPSPGICVDLLRSGVSRGSRDTVHRPAFARLQLPAGCAVAWPGNAGGNSTEPISPGSGGLVDDDAGYRYFPLLR